VPSKCVTIAGECVVSKETLWHLRLGHAPLSKIKDIAGSTKNVFDEICLTCPMSKFFKLPFNSRTSKTHHIFEIVHMDI